MRPSCRSPLGVRWLTIGLATLCVCSVASRVSAQEVHLVLVTGVSGDEDHAALGGGLKQRAHVGAARQIDP